MTITRAIPWVLLVLLTVSPRTSDAQASTPSEVPPDDAADAPTADASAEPNAIDPEMPADTDPSPAIPSPPSEPADSSEPLAYLVFAPAEADWALQGSPPWEHEAGPWQTLCDGACTIRMPAEAYRFRLSAAHPGARMPIVRESLREGEHYRIAATYERTVSYPDEEASIFGIVGAGAAALAMGILAGTLVTSADDGEVAGGIVLFAVGAAFVALAIWLGIDLGQPRHTDTFSLTFE